MYPVAVIVRQLATILIFIRLVFAEDGVLRETQKVQRVVACVMALVPNLFSINAGILAV